MKRLVQFVCRDAGSGELAAGLPRTQEGLTEPLGGPAQGARLLPEGFPAAVQALSLQNALRVQCHGSDWCRGCSLGA